MAEALYFCPFSKQVRQVYPSGDISTYPPLYFAEPSATPPDYMLPAKVERLRQSLRMTTSALRKNSGNRRLENDVRELTSALAVCEARLAALPETQLFELRGWLGGQRIATVMYADSCKAAERKAAKLFGSAYGWSATGRYSTDGKEWSE